MPPAARVTDLHVCPMVTVLVPHVGGPILPPGAPTVLIDFLPAATVTNMATCVGPPDVIIMGSTGVLINFLPAARLGDPTAHGGVITLGSPTCIIGEMGAPSPGAAGAAAISAGLIASLDPLKALASLYSKPQSPSVSPPCVEQAAGDRVLADTTAARIKKYTGTAPAMTTAQPGDFGPQLRSADISPCQSRAYDMGAVMRRFQRYTAALPSARAALNVNQLGDAPGSKAKSINCVKRLPDDANGINQALGLPPGTLTDNDLRDDKTGFRAAIYQDQTNGKLILVPRDTEPQSLVDWKTNTDNGQGLETAQYDEMRSLTAKLTTKDVSFDMAGYSKGGGLAQEAGLINSSGTVNVFNSAGIPDESVGRSSAASLDNLATHTSAFSSEGDFMTFVNQTSDPAQQIKNAEWLQAQLAKTPHPWNPVGLKYLDPTTQNVEDPDFADEKQVYLDSLQEMIDEKKADVAAGRSIQLFPPVRANSMDTIPNSMSQVGSWTGAKSDQPTFGKLVQHQMSVVEDGMENTVNSDRKAMQSFLATCP